MKLSARNQLEGTVKEVETGVIMAKVVLDVRGNEIVAIITKDSVDEMGLAVGRKATVTGACDAASTVAVRGVRRGAERRSRTRGLPVLTGRPPLL